MRKDGSTKGSRKAWRPFAGSFAPKCLLSSRNLLGLSDTKSRSRFRSMETTCFNTSTRETRNHRLGSPASPMGPRRVPLVRGRKLPWVRSEYLDHHWTDIDSPQVPRAKTTSSTASKGVFAHGSVFLGASLFGNTTAKTLCRKSGRTKKHTDNGWSPSVRWSEPQRRLDWELDQLDRLGVARTQREKIRQRGVDAAEDIAQARMAAWG